MNTRNPVVWSWYFINPFGGLVIVDKYANGKTRVRRYAS